MDTETESDARKEKLAEEAEDRIRRGAHWTDWMYVADGFAVGRAKAMRAAGTNQPYGKAYTRAFGDWMRERPWAREERIDKGTRSNLLWAADHRSEIEAWRDTLTQSERAKMNHPTTLRRRYDAAHKVAAVDPKAPKRETDKEALVRRNTELEDENAKLKRDGGSLFTLDSSHKMIAKIMGEEKGVSWLQAHQKAVAAEIADLKTRMANKLHAG